MNIRKMIVNFDYILFFTALALTVISVMFIYSANMNKHEHLRGEYLKQIFFASFGMFLMFSILFLNVRQLKSNIEIVYIIILVGIVVTMFFPSVKGQRRFNLFGISVQFAEFMKIAATIYLSKFYSDNLNNIRDFKVFLKGGLITFIPVAGIMLQPDLGSALVFIPILLSVSFVAGVKKRYLLFTILLALVIGFIPVITTINSLFFKNENEIIYLITNIKYISVIFIFLILTIIISILAYFNIIKGISEKFKVYFYWVIFISTIILIGLSVSYPVNKYFLKDYQKDRLLIFFNPYVDPMNRGYNVIQSMTAIGNGGVFGKGWKKGEMIQNLFVPEQSTDFIYPVIAEELGFAGTVLIMFLYSLFFYRGFMISIYSKDPFTSFITTGILSYLLFHILENIGMCIGIMPITGIPLPFLSYGGSFIASCYAAVGLLINFHINRYQY